MTHFLARGLLLSVCPSVYVSVCLCLSACPCVCLSEKCGALGGVHILNYSLILQTAVGFMTEVLKRVRFHSCQTRQTKTPNAGSV